MSGKIIIILFYQWRNYPVCQRHHIFVNTTIYKFPYSDVKTPKMMFIVNLSGYEFWKE